jgi:regulator of sirC expression with transglutaminase-like and TPR domain
MVRKRLAERLRPNGALDLVETALLVAAEEYPDLDVSREVARVHIIAGEAARQVVGRSNTFAKLDGLRAFLFEDLGFRGNLRRFKDPRNSYFNEVLNRRLGIPLTLSMLFIETARAAGFDAAGVGLPGHFVARVVHDGRTLMIDPFNGGRLITEEDCRQLVARSTGRKTLFRREHLRPVDERAMLARMLLNLKHVYVEQKDYARALDAVDRLLLLNPTDPAELRDRGFIKAHLGRPGAAIADLESYLAGSPRAADAEAVRSRVVWLRRHLSDMN